MFQSRMRMHFVGRKNVLRTTCTRAQQDVELGTVPDSQRWELGSWSWPLLAEFLLPYAVFGRWNVSGVHTELLCRL